MLACRLGHTPKMDVVKQFVAASEWPTAKKSAVLALGVGLPVLLVQGAIGHLGFAHADGAVDMRWFDLMVACFIGHAVITGAISAYVAARGHEGRWTAWLFLLPYLALVAALAYGFGLGSTVTSLPLVLPVMTASIFYNDLRYGIVAGTLAVAMFLAMGVALAFSEATYAPAFLDRRLEVLASPAVMIGSAGVILPEMVGAFLVAWIVTAALRRERARLTETRDRLDNALGLISKYVPAQLASGILSGTEAPSAGYRRQKVTSFFSDIVGFTELAEEMEPEELAAVLNEYFTVMAEIAERHHGTVDELQGDGLILVFGAPIFRTDREHALDAVRAASEMQAAIRGLNDQWLHSGVEVSITVRMGINTGVVTVGHFGTGNRLKYTVLGKHVNLAARVQAMCEPGKVLISNSTWLLVKDEVTARSLGQKGFKGITRPVEVHELV